MGFRTTITTEDLSGVKLPKWFVEKWKRYYNFGEHKRLFGNPYYRKDTLLISSKCEVKMYEGKDEEIFTDIQKICKKKNIDTFIAVMLHECGGITRVQIEKDKIRLSEPTGWEEVEEITHDYCYGCSDLDKEK
jgi:hypothetical protein